MHFLSAVTNCLEFWDEEFHSCMHRELLQLSVSWSRLVTEQSSAQQRDDFYHLSEYIDELAASLSAECARIEVEAMSLLALQGAVANRPPQGVTCPNDDDDDLSSELLSLDEATEILRKELHSSTKLVGVKRDLPSDSFMDKSDVTLRDVVRQGEDDCTLFATSCVRRISNDIWRIQISGLPLAVNFGF